MKKFLKNKKKFIIPSIAIILVIVFFAFKGGDKVEYVTAQVEKGNLKQTVSETGTIKAIKEIDLSFLQSGRLRDNFVDIGDKVKKGDVLAELDYSSLLIKQKEAKANLEVAQANLDKLLAGSTYTQVKVGQASVQQAQASYEAALEDLKKTKKNIDEEISQAQEALNDLLSDSSSDITPYEQAVITAKSNLEKTITIYAQYIDNYRDTALSTMENKLSVADTALDQVNQIISDRDILKVLSSRDYSYLEAANINYEESLKFLNIALDSLAQAQKTLDNDDVIITLSDSLNCLNTTFDCLNNVYQALKNTPPASYFTETQIESTKTTISNNLSYVSAGITSLQSAYQNLEDAILSYDSNVSSVENNLLSAQTNLEDAIKTARNTLSSVRLSGEKNIAAAEAKVSTALESLNYAKAQLDEIKAPARSQDVSLYKAQVKQAEAAYDLIAQQIEDSIIRSPINGTITKLNYEPGEQIVSGSPVVSVLNDNSFEIKVDISEADISKINVDDQVEITLDAFGDDIIFNGIVSFIDPAETVIQDVIYYKVTIQLIEDDGLDQSYYDGIKSGMTANVIIATAYKENVLLVPSRAILEKDELGKYVRVLENKTIKEVPIKTGLRGDGGMVEILSGLKEGEEIITFIKEIK